MEDPHLQSQQSNLNWSAISNQFQADVTAMSDLVESSSVVDDGEDEDDIERDSGVWAQMKDNSQFLLCTNFTEMELRGIWNDTTIAFEEARRRGPPPKIPNQDAFLFLLMWLKLGGDYATLSSMVHQKVATLATTLDRVRPIILAALRKRWENLPRPIPLQNPTFPYIGLVVDSTSIPVYRPMGPFNEAKIYWDTKNHMYALKKEVAVMAAPPHYGLFAQPKEVGSKHDYSIFKSHFESYANYLSKTTSEKTLIPSDASQDKWAILGDKAYVGPSIDTPTVRRMFIKRTPSITERSQNRDLKRIRVVVEQYFGRFTMLWKRFREVYTCDHSTFDEYFEICLWLTNEHIKTVLLTMEDRKLYKALLEEYQKRWEKKREKRQNVIKNYRERKKNRLQTLQ